MSTRSNVPARTVQIPGGDYARLREYKPDLSLEKIGVLAGRLISEAVEAREAVHTDSEMVAVRVPRSMIEKVVRMLGRDDAVTVALALGLAELDRLKRLAGSNYWLRKQLAAAAAAHKAAT